MKKRIFGALALTLTAALLAACAPPGGVQTSSSSPSGSAGGSAAAGSSQSQAEEKKVEGEISYWNMNAGGARDQAYVDIAEAFMEKYPGTKVTVSHFPSQEAQTKMELAAASDELPNVSDQTPMTFSTLRSMGKLYCLEDYLEESESIGEIMPNLLDAYRAYSPDGKLYVIPRNAQLSLLWYRSDKMDAPATWEDFFASAHTLTNPANKEYGYILRGKDGTNDALSVAYNYSGITEFFTADGKCTVNDPKHVEILEKYYAMYKVDTAESDIAAAFKDMTAAFGSGAVQMMYHNTGSYVDHLKNLGEGKFAATVLPAGNPASPVVVDQGSPGFVLATAKNGNVYTSFKFLDFIISADMQSLYHQAVGTVPTNRKVFDEPWTKERPHYNLVLDKLSGKNGETMVVLPVYLPDYSKIVSDVGHVGFQKVMTGETTVQQVLDDLAVAFENAYQEYLVNG